MNDDELLGPLKGHLLSEHGKGIKAINDEMLHQKKAAVDAATTTIEITKKKIEIFVKDKLERATMTCESTATLEDKTKEAKKELEKKFDEKLNEIAKAFGEHRAKGMADVDRKYEEVKRAKDEASAQLSEMADEGKLLVDLQHCHKLHYKSYRQTVLFTSNAMQVILKEQSLHHEKLQKS